MVNRGRAGFPAVLDSFGYIPEFPVLWVGIEDRDASIYLYMLVSSVFQI